MAIQPNSAVGTTATNATDTTTVNVGGNHKEIAMAFVVDSCTPSWEQLGEKYILPMVKAAMLSSQIKVGNSKHP